MHGDGHQGKSRQQELCTPKHTCSAKAILSWSSGKEKHVTVSQKIILSVSFNTFKIFFSSRM